MDRVPSEWREDRRWRSPAGGGGGGLHASYRAAYPSRWLPVDTGAGFAFDGCSWHWCLLFLRRQPEAPPTARRPRPHWLPADTADATLLSKCRAMSSWGFSSFTRRWCRSGAAQDASTEELHFSAILSVNKAPCLIAGWNEDLGGDGTDSTSVKVVDYLVVPKRRPNTQQGR